MKLLDLTEEVIYEDDELTFVAVLCEKEVRLGFKGSKAELIGKVGMKKAGALGSLALDHLKRYNKLKAASNRSIAFYARNTQERRAYEKVIKHLTKNKEYKVVRTFPYSGGARMWELMRRAK